MVVGRMLSGGGSGCAMGGGCANGGGGTVTLDELYFEW